tara:strand:- start:358 stop:708 length:351 start_codon:yes stop_codon:yes gene_type:complete
MYKLNDLFIRNLLNINFDMVLEKKYEFFLRTKKINYYYKNNDFLTYGFIIKTINGFYEIPIIGMKDIRKKKKLNKDLKYVSNKKNIIRILKNKTKIPEDILKNIIIKFLYNNNKYI